MSCDEISADWAAQRIKGLDLWSAMANARLESLRWNEKTRLWTITADGHWTCHTARHVICSAPIPELIDSIKSVPVSMPAAERLRYRDFLTVALVVDKPDLFPDNWIYVHEPKVKVGRIQNFRSWSPELVPDGKLACLGLEYFCFEGDGLWTSSDAELIALAKQELAVIGLVHRSAGSSQKPAAGAAPHRRGLRPCCPMSGARYWRNCRATGSSAGWRWPSIGPFS